MDLAQRGLVYSAQYLANGCGRGLPESPKNLTEASVKYETLGDALVLALAYADAFAAGLCRRTPRSRRARHPAARRRHLRPAPPLSRDRQVPAMPALRPRRLRHRALWRRLALVGRRRPPAFFARPCAGGRRRAGVA